MAFARMVCPAGQRYSFTIVCICYHKQRRYYPPDAIKTARQRMQAIAAGRSECAAVKSRNRWQAFERKEYRDGYVASRVRTSIALQILRSARTEKPLTERVCGSTLASLRA